MVIPLKILIIDSSLLADGTLAEQIAKLEKAGHSVTIDDSLKQYDFVTGPNCWLLRPEVANLFTLAVTNARKVVNANIQRVEQVKVAKVSKRTTKSTRKPRIRNSQVKGVLNQHQISYQDSPVSLTNQPQSVEEKPCNEVHQGPIEQTGNDTRRLFSERNTFTKTEG